LSSLATVLIEKVVPSGKGVWVEGVRMIGIRVVNGHGVLPGRGLIRV